MIDIEVHIKQVFVENLSVELEKEFAFNYPGNHHRTEVIELIAIAFQKYDDELGEDYLNRLNFLKGCCNKSVIPLVLEAFYYFHNDDFENALMYLEYSIEVTSGILNRYLRHLYQYIKLSDAPKTLEDDILTYLNEFIAGYESNRFSFQSLIWDINNTLPDNYPLESYLQLSSLLIEKNDRESDLLFYQFYILREFKQWDRMVISAKEFLNKFPKSTDISVVYSYMAEASYRQGKFIKAMQYYRNSIETPSDENEKVFADALNYKMSAICCLEVAKQRNSNPLRSHELLGWYQKAHDMFEKAIEHIDTCDAELYEKALHTKLIVEGMGYLN